MTNIDSFTPTQRAILILLESEDKNGVKYSPIPGSTHLVKELFAVSKDNLGKKLIPELRFEPDNFGPFDETIYAALESLKDSGFVYIESSPHHNKIKLTDKGKMISDDLWARLKDDVKILFSYTKRNFNHLSSEQLLEKIYSAYPEMTVNSISKVADKYRPINHTKT
ncbi:MAG: hypothetical protein ABR985_18420 [Methanotrichaceae archaeon]|jgi:uncharacterized protein YwgA